MKKEKLIREEWKLSSWHQVSQFSGPAVPTSLHCKHCGKEYFIYGILGQHKISMGLNPFSSPETEICFPCLELVAEEFRKEKKGG